MEDDEFIRLGELPITVTPYAASEILKFHDALTPPCFL
jgi:hypothetical protein